MSDNEISILVNGSNNNSNLVLNSNSSAINDNYLENNSNFKTDEVLETLIDSVVRDIDQVTSKFGDDRSVDFRTIEYVLGKEQIDESLAYSNADPIHVVKWLAFYNPIGNTETLQKRKQYLTEMALGTTKGTEVHTTRPKLAVPGIDKYKWVTENKRPGESSYSVLVIHAKNFASYAALKSLELSGETTFDSYTYAALNLIYPSSAEEESVIQKFIFISKDPAALKTLSETTLWNATDGSFLANFGITNGTDPISSFPMPFFIFDVTDVAQFLNKSVDVQRIAFNSDELYRIDKEQHALSDYLHKRTETMREEWGHVKLVDTSKRAEVEAAMAVNSTANLKNGNAYFVWSKSGDNYYYFERWNTLDARQLHAGPRASVDWYPETANLPPTSEYLAIFEFIMAGVLVFQDILIHNTNKDTNHNRIILVYPKSGEEASVLANLETTKITALANECSKFIVAEVLGSPGVYVRAEHWPTKATSDAWETNDRMILDKHTGKIDKIDILLDFDIRTETFKGEQILSTLSEVVNDKVRFQNDSYNNTTIYTLTEDGVTHWSTSQPTRYAEAGSPVAGTKGRAYDFRLFPGVLHIALRKGQLTQEGLTKEDHIQLHGNLILQAEREKGYISTAVEPSSSWTRLTKNDFTYCFELGSPGLDRFGVLQADGDDIKFEYFNEDYMGEFGGAYSKTAYKNYCLRFQYVFDPTKRCKYRYSGFTGNESYLNSGLDFHIQQNVNDTKHKFIKWAGYELSIRANEAKPFAIFNVSPKGVTYFPFGFPITEAYVPEIDLQHTSTDVMNVELRSFGNKVKVTVNDQVVTYQRFDIITDLVSAPGDTLIYDQGHIGFQSEGDSIKFQNIYIIQLTSLDQELPSV